MNTRTLVHVIESVPTSDGAGVKLRRSLGSQRGLQVDPFLMLDEFYSDNPDDYVAIAASRPSRTCSTAACAMRITWAIAATSAPAMCSG